MTPRSAPERLLSVLAAFDGADRTTGQLTAESASDGTRTARAAYVTGRPRAWRFPHQISHPSSDVA